MGWGREEKGEMPVSEWHFKHISEHFKRATVNIDMV